MKPIKWHTPDAWNIMLLLIRIWLGYRLVAASYSSVIGILTSGKERAFFEKWFGEELHFPFPVIMAFLAKGAESLGGILIAVGLFTRPASLVVAFTMLVATVTANLGEDFIIDGGFTISYFLFALVLIIWNGGKYSFDSLLFKNSYRPGAGGR